MQNDDEKIFLGGLINDFDGELHGITEDNFNQNTYKTIFRAIAELVEAHDPVNLVTVKDKLDNTGGVVDISTLMEVVNSTYTNASSSYIATKMKDTTKRIELRKVASEMMLYVENADRIDGELYEFANKILGLNTMSIDSYNIDNDIYSLQEYLLERKGKELFGWSWGANFQFLDLYTKGIQKGRTYRWAAPSNAGKSQGMYGVANSLLKQGAKVAFFILENEVNYTMANILANHQGVNSHSIEDGTVNADIDYIKAQEGKLFIIDSCYELGDIFAKVMEIKPDVVILDYIGLVQIKKVKEDDKYTEYSKQVQQFVKRSKVSWIDLSNLPKNQEDEDTIRAFGGFYGSSFLKNNTDVGIHMTHYKPFYEYKKKLLGGTGDEDLDMVFGGNQQEKDMIRNMQCMHLMITKNRIGTAKVETVVKINFNKGGRFSEATPEDLVLYNS